MKKEQNLQEPQKRTLNIPVFSKRYIEIKRDDLQFDRNNLPIDKITIYDFKGSVMSREEMRKAEQIIFVDGEQTKELKNRYDVW